MPNCTDPFYSGAGPNTSWFLGRKTGWGPGNEASKTQSHSSYVESPTIRIYIRLIPARHHWHHNLHNKISPLYLHTVSNQKLDCGEGLGTTLLACCCYTMYRLVCMDSNLRTANVSCIPQTSYRLMLFCLGDVANLLDVTHSNPLPHPLLPPPIPLQDIQVQIFWLLSNIQQTLHAGTNLLYC